MVPASITHQWYAPIPFSTLILMIIVGLIAALTVAVAMGCSDRIATAKTAKTLLGMPVMGTIPEPNQRGASQSPQSGILHITLRTSEWALFGMLLAAFLSSALDQRFADHFLDQPLSALADGVRHIVEISWS